MKKIQFVGVVEKTEDGRKKLFRKYYFRVLLPNGKSVSSTRFLQVGEDENTIYREFEKACIQEAAQALLSAARVRALAKGRFNVAYEDIRFAAPACLRHRLALNFEAVTEGKDMESVIGDIMAAVGEK